VQQVTRAAAPAAVSLPAPAPRTAPAVASVAVNAPPQLSYKESVTPIVSEIPVAFTILQL
jgi:hypothetical protein